VILTGSDLVATALKWDLEYLGKHLGPGPFAVFCHREDTDKDETPTTSVTTSSVSSASKKSNQNEEGSGGGVCASDVSRLEYNDDDDSSLSSSDSFNNDLNRKKAKKSAPKRLNVFKYYDETKLQNLEDKSSFTQHVLREELNFEEFTERMNGDR
jgi:hypothetical protein